MAQNSPAPQGQTQTPAAPPQTPPAPQAQTQQAPPPAAREVPEPQRQAPPAPPKVFKPLGERDFRPVHSSETGYGNLHGAMTPAGTDFDDVLRPDYWAIVAPKLRVHDIIDVRCEDVSFFGQLYVRSVQGPDGKPVNRAVVAVLGCRVFGDRGKPAIMAGHTVEWLGEKRKWCVVNLDNRSALVEKKNTREEAEVEMERIFAHAAKGGA